MVGAGADEVPELNAFPLESSADCSEEDCVAPSFCIGTKISARGRNGRARFIGRPVTNVNQNS